MSTSGLVPVTILGGYLGAGKTTLLNRLLAGDHGRRLAVLVNDFGAINIDADLITAHDGATISLQNGCICCSISDALGDALDRVLSLDPLPDQIVIEASGVADPAKIAHYGRGWPNCRLDAIVVLADAETIRGQARDRFVGELVTRQLRGGDLVILTKIDLVDEVVLEDVHQWIKGATGEGSMVMTAAHGQIDPALVLDPSIVPMSREPAVAGIDAGSLFDSFVFEMTEPVDQERLEAALKAWPAAVVRVKGIVNVAGVGPSVVQRVGRRWSVEPQPDDQNPAIGRLLVISHRGGVDRQLLLDALVTHA